MAVWKGSKPLDRPEGRVFHGEHFEPTDAERVAFADVIDDGDVASPSSSPSARENA